MQLHQKMEPTWSLLCSNYQQLTGTQRLCMRSCNVLRANVTGYIMAPLAGISDKQKVNYLMMWMDHDGECILQSLPQDPEECYKVLECHIHPTGQFRVARHHFSQLQQDKSEHIDSFVVKCRRTWDQCQFPEEVCDEILLDRIIFGVRHEDCQCKLLSQGKGLTLKKAMELI